MLGNSCSGGTGDRFFWFSFVFLFLLFFIVGLVISIQLISFITVKKTSF